MEYLPGRASIIQCFCHAKSNIQQTFISQISMASVYIKPETKMTAAANEDCMR